MYNYNLFNDNNWYRELKRNSYQNNMTSSLFNPTEGYNNGNLFTGLYSQYKNYRPATLSANNEKDQMMLELSRIAFAAHELNLYLDLHPTDQTMLALFNDYKNEADKLTKEYEARYGPLTVNSNSIGNSTFNWVMSWPWEESK